MQKTIIMMIIFFLTLAYPLLALDTSTGEDIILQQLENLNLADLQREIQKINKEIENYLPELNLADLIKGVIRGEIEFSWAGLLRSLLRYLGKEVSANFSLLGQIIILTVISAVLSIFHQSFSSKTISNTANSLIFLVIAVLILQAFNLAIQIGIEAVDNMVSFMQALLPVLLSILVSLGALTSAAIFQPLTLLIITTLASLIKNIVFPLIFLSLVLNIVTKINLHFSLTRLAGFFKETGMTLLGLLMVIFVAGLLLQGGAAAITDSLTLRTAKYLTGTFIPVIGGIFSDALDLIISCSLIIKNALNFAGILIIIIIIAFPIIKILALVFVYKVSSAIVQPVADGRIVEILNDTGNSLIMIFLIVAAVSLMFFIVLAIIAGTGNLSVMMR